ncbi:MAG: Zn-ribbon-containing protein, partial [Anaeroplasmataceae bacterium]|nr:Zn-ribbon-containing protein [Anaeroplasmataceae bacterium]
MYKVAKIKFIPLLEDKEASIDSLGNLMGCLYKNGQILEEYVVEDHDSYYIATVTTTDDNSLNECYYNEYIQKEIKNFEVSYEIIADDAFCEDSCHCKDPSYYIMDCDSEDSTNPVFCGDCGCEVPLYKIPYLDGEKEHYTIQEYRRLYNSVYRVWLHGLSDRYSRRELIHYKSKLNKEGSRICKELEEKLGKPVYFLIINPLACYYQYKKNNKNLKVCPKCKGKFRFIEDGYADKVCDKCR